MAAYYDPSESAEVKAGLLAWFCDALQDWKHEQVVWALRSWNMDNPRRRPTPGDIVALLKKARGEKIARERAAMVQPDPQPMRADAETRAKQAAMVAQLFPSIRRVPEVKE